jgi:signal transduction histidine kinase
MNRSVSIDLPGEASVPLRNRWLFLARIAWVMLAVLAAGIFLASVPAYLLKLGVLTGVDRVQLSYIGLTAESAASYEFAFDLVHTTVSLGSSLLCLVLAVAVFRRKSANWMVLFTSLFLLAYGVLFTTPLETLVQSVQPSATALVLIAEGSVFVPGMLILCYAFPDGRFVPSWTRWLALLLIPWALATIFVPGLQPTSSGNSSDIALQVLWFVPPLLTGVAAQIYRYRRVSNATERQQTKWVVFGASAPILLGTAFPLLLLGLVSYLTGPLAPGQEPGPLWVMVLFVGRLAWPVFAIFLPLSLFFAILRYRLFDIDIIINRALVYGTLTASVVGLYVLTVGSLGLLFQVSGNLLVSLSATGLVAVLFQPLRDRLQRGINRLMYGERDDPYAVLSRLGQRLEATLAPDAVLPTIAETVAQALKLPYAAIELQEGDRLEIAAAYGKPANDLVRLPLVYQNVHIGELALARRAPDEAFSPVDQRLLGSIAHQAGVAAHAVRLNADLQRSRERLVTAREEERRRLRRDLHDGLGPTLAAQTLKVGSARALLTRDPAAADKLLAQLEGDIEVALADIRRLVYNLRPPALDELGLVAAIRDSAVQYGALGRIGGAKDSDELHILVDAPEHLPFLPAAVEVAAYRIVQEALTNVVRHAHARTCRVSLSLDDEKLQVEIRDDGIGLPPERQAGVGLTSMRERAEELGGTCLVEIACPEPGRALAKEGMPNVGTRVLACLPCVGGTGEQE